MTPHSTAHLLLLATLASCSSCGSGPTPVGPAPGERLARRGDEIVVCGQLFHTGTPVVLWTDPGGYDAYRTVPRFEAPATDGDDRPIQRARYGDRRAPEALAEEIGRRGWRIEDLQQVVHQFVLHFDVCGTSRQCFKILQDKRNLSVHFLLDADGTIYQTLDLKERAWHASEANDASVGVEIAHIGAYPAPGHTYMRWYDRDEEGLFIDFPSWLEQGFRTPNFVARPARDELAEGEIHGKRYYQYDYTPQQYEALTHLVATLHRVLPRIRLEAPRDDGGAVLTRALTGEELAVFDGVIGHWHVTERKSDPGPALDWDCVLDGARALLR